jgi:hypothetical protein
LINELYKLAYFEIINANRGGRLRSRNPCSNVTIAGRLRSRISCSNVTRAGRLRSRNPCSNVTRAERLRSRNPCSNVTRAGRLRSRNPCPHSTVQTSDVRMRANQPRHSLSICGSQKDVQRMNLTNILLRAL